MIRPVFGRIRPLRVLFLLSRHISTVTMAPTPWIPGVYPPTRRSDHVDLYKSALKGEVRVSDPYQWLEEYSDETDKWTTSQEVFTRTYLDKNPDRQRLEDVFRSNMDYAKVPGTHHYSFSRSILFSSLLQHFTMMGAGIGFITAVCSPNRVSCGLNTLGWCFRRVFVVLYRSIGKKLPDFSHDGSRDEEIFFDVSHVQ